MQRIRAAAGLLASIGLAAAMASPAMAEPTPPTLTIETAVTHYLGGWWEQQLSFNVSCDGFETQEVWVDLPGATGDALAGLGSVPEGTWCSLDVAYWPEAGDNAGWNDPEITPGQTFQLGAGENRIHVTMPRVWADGWPPPDDQWVEHLLTLTVDRVYLNGKGGIEVEGTSWCPEAADVLGPGADGAYANANWDAIQYVGRKAAIHASYDSAIAHPCFDPAAPSHGPYRWETRYAYPSGALQFVYGWDGKFGAGTIHVDATSNVELIEMAQNFAPGGWTSFEGEYVAYDAACQDNDGDGWCVTRHVWSGWAPADLKPIRVK